MLGIEALVQHAWVEGRDSGGKGYMVLIVADQIFYGHQEKRLQLQARHIRSFEQYTCPQIDHNV